MLSSTYQSGDSFLHRASAATKLVGLLAVTTVLVLIASPWTVLAGATVVVVLGVAAGLRVRGLVGLVWPLRWIILLLTPVQVWTAGWRSALIVVGGLVVAMSAAGLVTLTTRVADMMDTVTAGLRPLGRFGVDADRVGLVMGLAIRAVPVVARTLTECGQARRARGLERSPRALLVPFVVRTVRHAERVGEALVARGIDD